jgi:hypothetical protein
MLLLLLLLLLLQVWSLSPSGATAGGVTGGGTGEQCMRRGTCTSMHGSLAASLSADAAAEHCPSYTAIVNCALAA